MQCPQCKIDVPLTEAQFGALYSCPKCMAAYFVGFDGQPEYGSMEQPRLETTDESFTTDFNLNPIEDIPSMDIPVQTYEFFSETSSSQSVEGDLDLNIETPRAVSSTFAAAAQEITDYGNQEELISNISYDVSIKGLDTKEVMLTFKDAIEDSKFAWLTQDILSQIKNGEVTLKNLNPIQAFVLATRIQFLDLDIEWKQNVAF
ncbi:MAG: hypothetical protein H7235_12140 [Bdellovibrionaceae bacterium]|nr:hypothetical protein [Pseudobdellovibrionaceae bacterium]